MENADKIWAEIQGKAVIKTAGTDRPYWRRDFSILDNNGHEPVFGQDISRQAG
jgi:hypothetical protein